MTTREKMLDRALAALERTGDEELDAIVDTADDIGERFGVRAPDQPSARAMFIEGVAARRRSIPPSIVASTATAVALLVLIAVMSRGALPGDSLYPIRNVLRSAGLAEPPTKELERELADAALSVARAQASFDRGGKGVERWAVAALMSLGRAQGYLDDIDDPDRTDYGFRIETLRVRAVALIGLATTLERSGGSLSPPDEDHSGRGSDDSDERDGDDDDADDSEDSDERERDDDLDDDDLDDPDDSDDPGSGSDDPDEDGSGPGSDDLDPDPTDPDED